MASLLNIRLRTYSTYIHRELASLEGHVLQLFVMEWTGNMFGHVGHVASFVVSQTTCKIICNSYTVFSIVQ